ncbi:hypothetical protein F2Q69_00053867 [Brassica cretica]|uniref:C3H1-type domain-containing protein n=1 Tax=Brassica cretica TaxID=69181 RepID=A0A8S9MV87_BRACR|nr:hypothetical protein F2Q69_00053867 [Brassica cretica]
METPEPEIGRGSQPPCLPIYHLAPLTGARVRLIRLEHRWLSSWGMQVPSCCCICTTEPESRDHLMLSCPFVLTLWAEIRIRLRCGVPNFSTWSELMLWACASAPAAPSILKLLVVQTLVYSVWRQRNSMLYSNCISPPLVVFKDINRQLPGARDCEQYLQTGQCSYGRRCRFNHSPTHLAPVLPLRVSRQICKYFQKGGCKPGSSIQYTNSMRGDGIEPMRQARTIPDYPSVIQDVSDEVGAGQNSWLQRRRAQENVQSGKIDCGQRRVSEEERTLRETVPCSVLVLYSQERQAYDLEEQKQRERVDENLRIDQIKATVQSDGGIQTEQRLEIPENLQEQAEMEREKREAQKKERSRSLTDNVDQLIQSLQDNIGIRRKKGDGA